MFRNIINIRKWTFRPHGPSTQKYTKTKLPPRATFLRPLPYSALINAAPTMEEEAWTWDASKYISRILDKQPTQLSRNERRRFIVAAGWTVRLQDSCFGGSKRTPDDAVEGVMARKLFIIPLNYWYQKIYLYLVTNFLVLSSFCSEVPSNFWHWIPNSIAL